MKGHWNIGIDGKHSTLDPMYYGQKNKITGLVVPNAIAINGDSPSLITYKTKKTYH